jgi:hypothetical protein
MNVMKINLLVFWVLSNMFMLSCHQKVVQAQHSPNIRKSGCDVFPIVFADSVGLSDFIVLNNVIYVYGNAFDIQERSKPVLDTIVSYLNGKNWNELICRIGSNTGGEFAFSEQLIIMHNITSYFEDKGIQEDRINHDLEVSAKNKSEYWITIILK